ncbi:hypothetical protein ACVLVH_004724 [Kluyvera sp. 1366]
MFIFIIDTSHVLNESRGLSIYFNENTNLTTNGKINKIFSKRIKPKITNFDLTIYLIG